MRVLVTAVAAFGLAAGAAAQEATPAVFTAAQAAAGKVEFAKSCARCHMPDLSGNNEVPALVGAAFRTTWDGRTIKELFEYMTGAMPPGGPALSVESYESITAYVLRSNGAIAGTAALKASAEVPLATLLRSALRPEH